MLKRVIIQRVRRLLTAHPIGNLLPRFIIAGNALNAIEAHDIDIFPFELGVFAPMAKTLEPYTVSKTRNAVTAVFPGYTTVQLCNYQEPTLRKLISTFDFAHIQVGAMVECGDRITVTQVEYTEDYVEAVASGTTWFMGSRYPLSSLIRCGKYLKYGQLPKQYYMGVVLEILADVVERGFRDREDFKDQIDAVDLGLVAEDGEISFDALMIIYERLHREEVSPDLLDMQALPF